MPAGGCGPSARDVNSRAFDLDVLRCPRCAGRMELIATIDDPAVIHRMLADLGLPGARDDPESAVARNPRRAMVSGVPGPLWHRLLGGSWRGDV